MTKLLRLFDSHIRKLQRGRRDRCRTQGAFGRRRIHVDGHQLQHARFFAVELKTIRQQLLYRKRGFADALRAVMCGRVNM